MSIHATLASALDDMFESPPEAYRVSFWRKLNDPDPPLVPMWDEEIWRLEGAADARDAIAWAEENGAGRTYTLYAEIPYPGKRRLVHIVGTDPTQAG